VLFETYFDYDGRGTNSVITGGRFPHSLLAFRSAFKRTNVEVRVRGSNPDWFVLAAVVAAVVVVGGGGMGLRRGRRGRRHRLEPVPRRIYPPVPTAVATPVREWAEQVQ
jgi:hypothetical protein